MVFSVSGTNIPPHRTTRSVVGARGGVGWRAVGGGDKSGEPLSFCPAGSLVGSLCHSNQQATAPHQRPAGLD